MDADRLRAWLVRCAELRTADDRRFKGGAIITSTELAQAWCSDLGESSTAAIAETRSILDAAMESLCDARRARASFCVHGRLFPLHGPCQYCGQAIRAAIQTQGTGAIRSRIWEALCRCRHGATRYELSKLARTPEKTICWAAADWQKAGMIVETDEERPTPSGRKSKVLRLAANA